MADRADRAGQEQQGLLLAGSEDEAEAMDWADNLEGLEVLLNEDEALQGPASEPPRVLEPEPQLEPQLEPAPPQLEVLLDRENEQLPPPLEGMVGSSNNNDREQQEAAAAVEGAAAAGASSGSGGGGRAPTGVMDRARKYMAKVREAQSTTLRGRLGDRVLAYDAVLKEKRRRLTVSNLVGGGLVEMPEVGSMLSNGDQRILSANLSISLGQYKIATYSFNTATMMCQCDGEHSGVKIAGGGGERAGGMEAFLLVDQSYPAILPAHGKRKCLKIVRLEHGMLQELASEFVSLMKGRFLEAGGLVLLFSATNLAAAGIAGYTADLMHSIGILKKEIGEHLVYAPLPHFFGAGCGDEAAVRGAAELSAWAADVFGRGGSYLKHSFIMATDIMVGAGQDGTQPAVSARHRLPTKEMQYRTWASAGLEGLPRATRPAGEREERELLCSIISEIRCGMAIDLDPSPSFERGVAADLGGSGEKVLVVGGSYAHKLHTVMREGGTAVELLYFPDWRVQKTSVEQMVAEVEKAVHKNKIEAVVFQVMDDTIYTAITEEGEKIPPRKIGNVEHIEGDLSVVDRAVLSKLLRLCMPLVAATTGIKTVWIGPLPRYVTGSCCQEAGHVANRQQRGFLDTVLESLEEVHRCTRDYLFTEGMRHARVMNPWVGLRSTSPSNIWGEDPVYIKKELMPRLAEGVKITLNKISLKRRGEGEEPETKRGRRQPGGNSGGEGRRDSYSRGGSSRGSGGGSGGGRGGRYRN
jgi:uncharacterized membrane protein YgcG